jgi:hypothetical protein
MTCRSEEYSAAAGGKNHFTQPHNPNFSGNPERREQKNLSADRQTGFLFL